MPLVGAASVEFQDEDISVAAIGMEGRSPGCRAFSRDIDIAARVDGDEGGAPSVIRIVWPVKGVPALELVRDVFLAQSSSMRPHECKPSGTCPFLLLLKN